MTDLGGMNLAFAVLLGVAAYMLDRRLAATALSADLVAAVSYLVFHMGHLEHFERADAIGQTIALSLRATVPLALLLLTRHRAE